jgi:hypothetical protein
MISTASEHSSKFLVHWLIMKMFMDLFLELCTHLKRDEISKVICRYSFTQHLFAYNVTLRMNVCQVLTFKVGTTIATQRWNKNNTKPFQSDGLFPYYLGLALGSQFLAVLR